MKKKLLISVLFVVLSLSVFACGNKEEADSSGSTPQQPESSEPQQPESSEPQQPESSEPQQPESGKPSSTPEESKTNDGASGGVEVDENLFSVEITIPADFVGEQTQEELDKISEEQGYKSIVLNEDGSATYTMTKKQHEDMLSELKKQINDGLEEMIGSEDYPSFTKIEANDDFTQFTITTKNSELDFAESFSVILFYMYGGLYSTFSGEEVDNINVKFVNESTGELITESNSKDME